MRRLLKYGAGLLALVVLAGIVYGAKGYFDALSDAEILAQRADNLIEGGTGPEHLGEGRAAYLLAVQDPGFAYHAGMDFTTPGAGLTTMTQSLSKRLAFDAFKPGIGKIRQTGYALGLEQTLSKQQIFALFLQTVEMGKGPNGWMTGFFAASQKIHGRPVAALTDDEFLHLVAVMVAPSRYNLLKPDPALEERVRRIKRLVSKVCVPSSLGDVWLDGCA
jgi:monofunctional glycosyltransferase